MAYAHCLARCYVAADAERVLARAERILAELRTVAPQPGYFTDTFCVRSRFFHPKNGARVDAIRERIAELELPGYAIGGLAVGETAAEMYDTIETVEEFMPRDKPRYLMGVGTPGNIIEAVHRGIDFFDCVMPARNGRHGHLFTWSGIININNEKYALDADSIDPLCSCPVCRTHSRAYLRHLFKAGEVLALRLAVMHNLYFYNELVLRIRNSLENGEFGSFRAQYSEILDKRV